MERHGNELSRAGRSRRARCGSRTTRFKLRLLDDSHHLTAQQRAATYASHRAGHTDLGVAGEAIEAPASRDHVGCARALLALGMPVPDEERYTFSAEVTAIFDEQRMAAR